MKLGDKLRDKVTGVEGVAISVTRHLTGCDRWTIDTGLDQNGNLPQWEARVFCFDVMQLEVVEPGAVSIPAPLDVPSAG